MSPSDLHRLLLIFRHKDAVRGHLKTLLTDRKKYVIDFSSPNIAKPFHFAHLRSTVLGNFISNLLTSLDQSVVRINYLGDFGTQFGLLSLGFDRYGSEEELERNGAHHLLDVYVKINKDAETCEKTREEGKSRFMSLESDCDPRIRDQWIRFRDLSVHHYQSVYQRLGIQFDHIHYESMYSKSVEQVVEMIRCKNLLHESLDGAKFARIRDDRTERIKKRASKNTPKINEQDMDSQDPELIPLVKKDGSSLYLSRDVAAAIDRWRKFDFHQMLYVVENGQMDHFVNLKRILRALEFNWSDDLHHVKFGRIAGMSTRKGTIVLLEDLLNEARDRALKTLQETETTRIPREVYTETADVLGISGILVNDLRRKRTVNYTFDWDQVLRQKGETGIALQYAHARLCRLEEMSGYDAGDRNAFLEELNNSLEAESVFQSEEGISLLKCLHQFDDAILHSFKSLDPMFMSSYLFELSHCISKGLKVLPVKHESRTGSALTRLSLFSSAKNVLGTGMQILGLRPLDAM